MAIIKCPECNHEISDKAPSCPSCGAPIAGHVTTCSKCGYTYFSDRKECPKCHHREIVADSTEIITNTAENVEAQTTDIAQKLTSSVVASETKNSTSRNNKVIIGIVAALVLVVCSICYFFYSKMQGDREEQAYEYAMSSNDAQVLQNYLDQYTDAPEAHRDSVTAHLNILQQLDRDWTNVLVSGSKSDLQRYIDEHPDSPFKAIAVHKIDSIDWSVAQSGNTVESIELYIEQHQDGEHIEEANDLIKKLNANTVQPEDKQLVEGVVDGMFQSLSSHDEDGLTSSFNPLIAKFLGKSNATRADVVTFMQKIYKNDVSSMKWQTLGDYTITKKEVGERQYEYSATFSTLQSVTHTDNNTTEARYRVSVRINPDGRIVELNMTKILE